MTDPLRAREALEEIYQFAHKKLNEYADGPPSSDAWIRGVRYALQSVMAKARALKDKHHG